MPHIEMHWITSWEKDRTPLGAADQFCANPTLAV
jgi:hypothetical protein